MNKQEAAFEKLSKLKVGALFMACGTGKTKVALDLISSKIHKVDYVLYICPVSVKNEIEAERLKWHPELILDVVGVESLSQSDRIYLETLNKIKQGKSFIVVDESLKIKNLNAKRTERILQLGEYASYKLILNGTPISKNVLDLYPQMNFLSPKILNMSFNQFKDQYCEYYVRGQLKGLVKKQYNIEHLISLIRPYIFDCELDLEVNKKITTIKYEMDNIEEYQAIKSKFFQDYCFDFMALSTSLQKHFTSSQTKKKEIDKILEKVNDRIIIFVKFLDNIPEEATRITGDIPLKERKKILKDFKDNKFKTLYITYGCGTFGLNLQFCKHMIFADHTFDYAIREQAEDRIYRIGQDYDVNYYDLKCKCGLEELITKSLDKKANLLDEIKKEIEKKGVEEWLKNI